MPSRINFFSRRAPDTVTEELVAALSGSKSYEFKALFSVIHAALRARNAASGGEEMLRLRTYEKLQNLVQQGQVKKTGKKYKGVTNALLLLSESLKEFRKNGPSFSPQAVARSQTPIRLRKIKNLVHQCAEKATLNLSKLRPPVQSA
jgi:hypothetical protein